MHQPQKVEANIVGGRVDIRAQRVDQALRCFLILLEHKLIVKGREDIYNPRDIVYRNDMEWNKLNLGDIESVQLKYSQQKSRNKN